MINLSKLAKDSMWSSSMAGGNMTSSNRAAMTAPGSSPVDPMPAAENQDDPAIPLSTPMKTGTSGKPQASGQASYVPAPVRWGPVSSPEVTRSEPAGTSGVNAPRRGSGPARAGVASGHAGGAPGARGRA